MIFDSHAHYNSDAYNEDRDNLLKSMFDGEVVGIIDCCAEPKDFSKSRDISERYEKVYSAYGLHPEALRENDIAELLRVVREDMPKILSEKKVVALGECGLDYYYDTDKELQKQLFAEQLKIAVELDMPVLLHNRDSHADMLAMLKKYPIKGVMHCFSGSVEYMKEITRLGLYIGIGGIVTFKNAKVVKEVARELPQDRLLLETDCPYLAPEPFRGKRCDSSMISYTAAAIAELCNTDTKSILEQTYQNTKELFLS